MPPRRAHGRRPEVESGVGNEPDPRDIEIQNLRQQVERLTQRLEHLELPNHREDYNDDTDAEEFINPFHSRSPVRRRRHMESHEDTNRGLNIKFEIPEYNGTIKGDSFYDWLNTVEKVFAYKDLADHKKVKLVAIKLHGKADAWWEQLQKSRQRMGKPLITSWEKMKKYMNGYFLPPTYKQTHFMRLQNLQQENRSVDDYTKGFQHLLARNDVMEDEDQLVGRYKGRLLPSIW
ncbi:hypothetical protein AAC387_Pa02g0016 [Persea americana]